MKRACIATLALLVGCALADGIVTKRPLGELDYEEGTNGTPVVVDIDVGAFATTGDVARVEAQISAVATNAAPRAATVAMGDGAGGTTNLTARVVYSASPSPRASLIIREVVTAAGERQYRLIRREEDE